MTARTIQHSSLDDERSIELVGRGEGEHELYVEGVHGMNVSGPVLKMNFYTLAIDSAPGKQRRESVCRLVMGVPQFLRLADFFAEVSAQMRKSAPDGKTAPESRAAR